MIRVMIVEDEPAIGRMLKSLIEKSNPEFQIIAMAENGKEAIELFQKKEIDVIFTDIRMPVLDGFGLLEYLKQEEADVFTVLVSGYDDFEYARRGIKYQVYDYLLKIVSAESLKNLLERLCSDIWNYKREKKRTTLYKAMTKIASSVQKLETGNYKFVLICAGSAPYSVEDNMLPGSRFWSTFQIDEEMKNLLYIRDKRVAFWEFEGTTDVERILVFEKNGDMSGVVLEEELWGLFQRRAELPITIVTHKGWISLGAISVPASRARAVMYENSVFGKGIVLYTENNKTSEISSRQEEQIEKMMVGFGNGRKFQKEPFEKFCAICKEEDITQRNLLRCLNLLFSYMVTGFSGRAFWEKEYDASLLLSNLYTYKSLVWETMQLFDNPADSITENPVLIKVKQYLEEHFAEPLTNESIAEEFGFASSYLCRIFKKEYGVSMGGHLLQVRMEHARRIFRKEPGIMVKEVAERVGYKDQFYFSKVFYKETGVWPAHFK